MSCIYHNAVSINCISLHHVFLQSVLMTTKTDQCSFKRLKKYVVFRHCMRTAIYCQDAAA